MHFLLLIWWWWWLISKNISHFLYRAKLDESGWMFARVVKCFEPIMTSRNRSKTRRSQFPSTNRSKVSSLRRSSCPYVSFINFNGCLYREFRRWLVHADWFMTCARMLINVRRLCACVLSGIAWCDVHCEIAVDNAGPSFLYLDLCYHHLATASSRAGVTLKFGVYVVIIAEISRDITCITLRSFDRFWS